MPDVRSRSLSPGSARAVDARERSEDSKLPFGIFLAFFWLFQILAFGNGFSARLPIRFIPKTIPR
jgi:hypothetical protein